tara:strand:- start:61 stop:366 length:306 start_codon:yes stop_codon:yes gene_type:complete
MWKVSSLEFMIQRRVGIVKAVMFLFKINMAGNAGKPIVFGNLAQVIFAMVLFDDMFVPRYQHFIEVSGYSRDLDQLVKSGPDPDIGSVFHVGYFFAIGDIA